MLRRGWTLERGLIGVVLGLLSVAACYRAWADVAYIAWRDEEASQVWLAPFIFLWLLWVRADALRRTRPEYSFWGPALMMVALPLNVLGFLSNTEVLWHGSAVLALVAAGLTVVGPRVLQRMVPAVLVLAFVVPVPASVRQEIAIPLQQGVAYAAEFVFDLMFLDVERSGNLLIFNGQAAMIAEACNGMRMMFALLLVSYAFAFGSPLLPSVRAMLLVLAPVVAILCNIIRVVPTVILIGYDPEMLGTLFHDFSAWLMLGVAFGMLLGLVRLLRWAEVPVYRPNAALLAA